MSHSGLARASRTAALALSSQAEISAGEAIGLPTWHPFGASLPSVGMPLLLPVLIDCYVWAALERRKDVPAALTVLAVAVIGGHAFHATTWQQFAGQSVFGILLVIVLARVEILSRPDEPEGGSAPQVTATVRAAQRPAVAATRRAPKPIEASVTPSPKGVEPKGGAMDKDAAVRHFADLIHADPEWRPDWQGKDGPTPMTVTGWSKSWCEQRIAEARKAPRLRVAAEQ